MNRPVVHLVGHDAWRKGAQIGQLSLARWLAAGGRYDLRMTLIEGGHLVPDFRAVIPAVAVLDEPSWPRLARTLHRRPRFAPWDVSGADVLLVNSAASLPALVGRSIPCPVVLYVHELESVLATLLEGPAGDLLRTLPVHWLAASRPVAENLAVSWGVPADGITVVPEFIADRPGPPPAQAPAPATVLGCGFMDHRKGGDLFLAAAEHHRRTGRVPADWVWVGERAPTLAVAADTGVRLPGPTDDPGPWFEAATVFALTSREDPMPLVALEALQHGRPVVCFAGSGGIPDVVRGQSLGIGDPLPVAAQLGSIVPGEDAAAFADAVDGWLADEPQRTRLLTDGPALIGRHHTVEAGGAAISAILDEVLAR